jgi:CYTH domain-containing protein
MTQAITKMQIPMEHERRFFPNLVTFTFDKDLYPSTLITQAYLEDNLRTRIRDEFDRLTGHTYTQTRKTGEGISRPEDEHKISKKAYDAMLTIATCQLVKIRYFMQCDGFVAQINFFEGDLTGYAQIEVEFDTEEEAKAFIPPVWFGLEVTNDNRHGNYSLAKYGCKDLLSC